VWFLWEINLWLLWFRFFIFLNFITAASMPCCVVPWNIKYLRVFELNLIMELYYILFDELSEIRQNPQHLIYASVSTFTLLPSFWLPPHFCAFAWRKIIKKLKEKYFAIKMCIEHKHVSHQSCLISLPSAYVHLYLCRVILNIGYKFKKIMKKKANKEEAK
jgi:hypothetical protein